jgi:serine/threonine protein kinase
MAVTSASTFWDLLEKSGLLSAPRLNELRPSLGDESDAKVCAKRLVRDGVLTRWQVIQLLYGRSGLTFGKYKLMDQLQADHTGRVFLAEHLQLGRQVILKTLSRSYATSHPDILRQFLQDAQNLAGLDHRNIVHVFDVDSHEDRYFLVMEYAVGRNLQELIEAAGPMSYDRIARYVSQAAAGLAYAHQRNMYHGDIRPANFVVDGQDNVKILNLGVRRLVDEDESQEVLADSGPAELVDFLAPEQELGAPATDPRCDLYSLGAVMYFLFTARPPFPEGTEEDRRRQHATQAPPAIQSLRADAPPVLVDICGRLLAKDPAARFQSAAELAIAGTTATAAPTDPQAFWEVAQQATVPAQPATWTPELPPAAPAPGELDFLSASAPAVVTETVAPGEQPWDAVPQAAPATTDSGGFFDFLGDEEAGSRRKTPPPRKTASPRKPAAQSRAPETGPDAVDCCSANGLGRRVGLPQRCRAGTAP